MVRIVVDGKEVVGEILHRSAGDIAVRIQSPYPLSAGLHIPHFARSFRTFDSEYGDEVAANLIEKLYKRAVFIQQNLKTLQRAYAAMQAHIRTLSDVPLDKSYIQEKRRELRKKLRNGELDGKALQKCLAMIRKQCQAYESRVSELTNAFFRLHFSGIVPHGVREQVMAILCNREVPDADIQYDVMHNLIDEMDFADADLMPIALYLDLVLGSPDKREDAMVKKLAGVSDLEEADLRRQLRGVVLTAVKLAAAQVFTDPREYQYIAKHLESDTETIHGAMQHDEALFRLADRETLPGEIGKAFAAQCHVPDNEDYIRAGGELFEAVFRDYIAFFSAHKE